MSVVNIVIPVSREDYLQRVFSSIELLETVNLKVNLIAIVDGSDDLFVKTRNIVQNTKFNEKLCVQYSDRTPVKSFDILARRKRIADIHNELKQYISKSDYIFLVEDDGVLPSDALLLLHREYLRDPYMGFITGMELGRWGVTYLGLWKVDDIYNITKVTSLGLPESVQNIDASGIYCMLTTFEIYMSHEFKPYGDNELGPDFDFGIELRKQGYHNKVHNLVKVKHITKTHDIDIDKSNVVTINIEKHNNKLKWIK